MPRKILLCLAATLALAGCKREPADAPAAPSAQTPADTAPSAPVSRHAFSPEMTTGDFAELVKTLSSDAFEGRGGRAGRGRLWPAIAGSPDMTDTGQMQLWGSGDWGGIVFPHRDRAKLAFGPGFVTDMDGHFTAALTNARDWLH